MFRCQACNKLVGPRIAPITIVVAKREQTYHNKPHRDWKDDDKSRNKRSWEEEKVIVTHGWEIVKELKVCQEPTCRARAI